jgi:hypothetical protein
VYSASLSGASSDSSFPKVVLPWTPSKSRPSQKFHPPGIYANSRAYKEKLTFYGDLSQTMPLEHMVSFAYYATTSHSTGMNMPKKQFDDLKMALSNAPLISSPDYNRDYILYISASTVSVAGVLIQIGDDDREHVIYYISKNLSGPPLKYNHEEKLALAVVLAVQKLRHYILLRTTKVIADSNPMQYLLSRRQINGKFARWIVILQEYDLEFSTPKSKKALVLAELVTAFPSDTTSAPVNTDFPDEHLFYITSDDPWYGDLLVYL